MPATSPIVRARSWSAALTFLPLSFEVFHEFAHHESFADAWSKCERPDYLLRFAGTLVKEKGSTFHRSVARAACACALTSLSRAPDGDERPRLALSAVDRWCDGDECAEALAMAWQFAEASALDLPNYAAWSTRAAVETTAFNADKAPLFSVANAARNAARFALTAREESRGIFARELADTVRTIVPLPPLFEVGR